MPRLFLGNFDFELHLAARDWRDVPLSVRRVLTENGRGQAPFSVSTFSDEEPVSGRKRCLTPALPVRRVLAEFAPCWAAAADDGDFVWCPERVDSAFFEELHDAGLPLVRPVSERSEVPAGLQLIPWGWTNEVIEWGRSVGAVMNPPPLEVVPALNSRRFSLRMEQELGVALPGCRAVETLDQLLAAVEEMSARSSAWVVKAAFSNSGREQFRCRRRDVVDLRHLRSWAERRLVGGQGLFLEPWVERLDEVGIQLTLVRNGKPRIEGVTRLITDGRGGYRGSEFTPRIEDDAVWRPAIDAAMRVAAVAAEEGYFGPLGIDAMRYRDPGGELRLRPIQDVNARWTMGRLSLGLRRFLKPGERGVWLHGPDGANSVESHERVISTSPLTMAGRPVEHQSCIVIGGRS